MHLAKQERLHRMKYYLAFFLMTFSLASAVFLRGGVYPRQWEWSALGISVASVLWILPKPNAETPQGKIWELKLLAVLLGWMWFQLIPLPLALIERLSPSHWTAVAAAREATGHYGRMWIALSVSPPATMERLLAVVPAMAIFVAAREMGWQWRHRIWIAVAPVIGVAWLESILGLLQFYSMRISGGQAGSVAGTYINRNHFAGLLEMAFPLAVMWAVAKWRRTSSTLSRPVGLALSTAALVGIAACLLLAVALSLSRMGFISTLIGVGFTSLILLASWANRYPILHSMRWIIPLGFTLCILIALPSKELILRFADIASTDQLPKDARLEIWKNSLQLVSAYKWTGCGLGAYERGLYRYKTTAPINTIDFAHNDYLQILAELGIFGAILAALLLASICWKLLSVVLWKKETGSWELAVGLLVALLTIGLHSLTDFNLYIPANALAFAWLCGTAISPGIGA